MKTKSKITTLGLAALVLTAPSLALANDAIIRPYESVRTMGMGGVLYTTGEYDENFFGNPARATENQHFKVELPDFTTVVSAASVGDIGNLTSSSGSTYQKISGTAGDNN